MRKLYRGVRRVRDRLPAMTSVWATMIIYGALTVVLAAAGPKVGAWVGRINERDTLLVWFVIGAVYGHAKWCGAKDRYDGDRGTSD